MNVSGVRQILKYNTDDFARFGVEALHSSAAQSSGEDKFRGSAIMMVWTSGNRGGRRQPAFRLFGVINVDSSGNVRINACEASCVIDCCGIRQEWHELIRMDEFLGETGKADRIENSAQHSTTIM